MSLLLVLLVIITIGLVFTEVSARFQVPYVTALILAGVIFGSSGINVIEVAQEISFLGSIGVIFLMFLAGTTVDLKGLSKTGKNVSILAATNSLIPFIVGFAITYAWTKDTTSSILMGIIFISSAIAVIIPTLDKLELIKTKLGGMIITTTVVEDMVSLILLAVFIQQAADEGIHTILLSLAVIVLLLIGMRKYIRKFINFIDKYEKNRSEYESRLRFILAFLFSIVVLFELLGLNAIIASFIAGMLIGDYVQSEHLEEKMKTISYGIFIPIFFFIVGVQTNIKVFTDIRAVAIMITVVIGLLISKSVSGYIGARFSGYSKTESLFFGFATTPQLSTTLAVAFAAVSEGLMPEEFLAAIVVLTIVTATVSPLILNRLGQSLSKRSKNIKELAPKELEVDYTI